MRRGTTVHGLQVVMLNHATAATFSTLMRENDLPDLISRMPRRAIPQDLHWAIKENGVPLVRSHGGNP